MDATALSDFLDQAIAGQRAALRFYLGATAVLLMLAALSALFGFWMIESLASLPSSLKWGGPVTGGFIAALSGIPSKEIFQRRDKLAALELLRAQLLVVSRDPQRSATELERILARIWGYAEKSLGG